MGHKVQSRAGESITDVYDVKGSQAPIESIDVAQVKGVHELGQTIFSERFSVFTRRVEGEFNQSTAFNLTIGDLPGAAVRILGLCVFVTDVSEITTIAVSVESPAPQAIPIWVWDGTNSIVVRFRDLGVIADQFVLVPSAPLLYVPTIFAGIEQPQLIDTIAIRGTTAAFGAGQVKIVTLAHLAFADIGGISSRGLPVPSW